ncbi:MAG: type IV secretion system protein [Candidatus Saccharibacteria bacterium]|nr:type IV secretion system protein [Candidatus Saccharibacteria bacterium]
MILTLFSGCFISAPVQAISTTNDNGCFVFSNEGAKKDQIVCPDQFCGEQQYCSNDGKRCYCIPQVLSNSDKNKSCEALFGSKMKYVLDNKGEPTVYLYGGLWTELATYLISQNKNDNVGVFKDELTEFNAIIFKRSSGNVFTSSFLFDLYHTAESKIGDLGDVVDIQTLLDIDISISGSSAYAKNQRYRVIGGKSSSITECGLYSDNNKLLFSKYSPVPVDTSDGSIQYSNPCIMPASILKMAIFGQGKIGWFDEKEIISNLTRNCTDLPWSDKDSWLDVTGKWLSHVFSPNQNNNDMHVMIANMIVPYNKQRMVYFDRPNNFFLGKIIDGNDNAGKIKEIREGVCKQCAANGLNNISSCQDCNNEKLLNLIANSNLPLNQIIAKELIHKGGGKFCNSINRSFDNIGGADDSYKPKSDSETETKLNKTLPNGLIYICENANLSKSDRLKCKKNALNCYMQSLNEYSPEIGCENLVGELDTSRWIVCPAANTAAKASDQGQGFILDLIRNSGDLSFFNDKTFNNAWKTFRNISNAFLVLAVLAVIFSYITGVGLTNYQIKRIIPRLFIVIILINLSIFIAKFLIDVANITGSGIYQILVSFDSNDSTATFINTIGSIVSKTALTVGLGVTIVLLGAIGLLIPAVLVFIFGLFFIFVLLAFRQALMILLVVLMPIVFVSLLFPFTERLFDTWRKNFTNVLLVYPIMCLLVGSGVLLKSLLLAISGDTILRLLALIMPVLTTCLAPFVLITSLNGLELIKNKLTSAGKLGTKMTTKIGRESTINKNISGNLQRAFDSKVSKSRFSKKILKSRTFNFLTAGAGQRLMQQQLCKDAQVQQQYSNIIGNDRQLLQAFIDNSDTGLDNAQQQKFKMLTNLGARKDNLFYFSAVNTVGKHGFTDQTLLRKIVTGAEKTGSDDGTIIAQMRGAAAMARKSGQVSTAALLNYDANTATKSSLTSAMSAPIDHEQLLNETVSVLQKTPSTSIKADNFNSTNFIATDRHPAPTYSIVEEALTRIANDDLSYASGNLTWHGTYTESLGRNFDFMNPETQKVVGKIIIGVANTYSSNVSRTAQEAIKNIEIGRKK